MVVEKKRGQISFEYMVVMGFVTLVISILLGVSILYTNTVQDRVKVNHIDSFADKIISTSEYVFYAGEPSKATITSYLPQDVTSIEIDEDVLFISIRTSSGLNKIGYPSKVNLTDIAPGNINTNEGLKNFEISAVEISAGENAVKILQV